VGLVVDPPSEGVALVNILEATDTLAPDKYHVNIIPESQASFIITEQAHLSIRSDRRHNPADPGHDMTIPPATYDKAVKHSNRTDWLKAMETELGLMKEMEVWELVEPPAGRKLIGNHWVFEFKTHDVKGGGEFKARLVAQGFSQVPGIDFHQTYAPVARQASIKILIAMVAMLDWELDCFDAKRAFLHGKLKEDLYMKQPRGFEQYGASGILLVCHLLSSLYGLKQAALDWYKLLSAVLIALGFYKSKVDFAVFIFHKALPDGRSIICIIAWHVDDGLGASNNRPFVDWVKQQVKDHFRISDMGAVSMYLGIEIVRDRTTREAWIH
jgi:hypothetical protein